MSDSINHPAHYTAGDLEVIDAIEGMKLGYHEGNIVKYMARYQLKGGVEDLKKAQWYLCRLISKVEKQGDDGPRVASTLERIQNEVKPFLRRNHISPVTHALAVSITKLLDSHAADRQHVE